jgi:hypothetical protein
MNESVQPPHEHGPGEWRVQRLADRNGARGRGTAYTIGLVASGYPELYMEPDPHAPGATAAGLALPGPDERAEMVTMAAERVLSEQLGADEVFRQPLGDGRTTVRFWFGPEHRTAGALAVALPEARTVVPLHWAVESAEAGPG